MNGFGEALARIQENEEGLRSLFQTIDVQIIAEALNLTGKQSIRRRKLPAEQVVFLVLGMTIFRNMPISLVASSLDLSLAGPASSGSLCEARKRVGSEPLKYIFHKCASAWSNEKDSPRWKGLQLFAIDGTSFRLPDSDANFDYYGKPSSRREESAYPQAHCVALMDLSQRLIVDAEIGPYSASEAALAERLIGSASADSLCLMDRGFQSYARFSAFMKAAKNSHFLCRAKMGSIFCVEEHLEDGSMIATLNPSAQAKKDDPSLPTALLIRVIDYEVKGHPPVRLFSSLIDPKIYPAKQLAEMYHQRWNIELGFDEFKTDLLMRQEALRSKSVDGIKQELWASLIMYNLIRRQMYIVAKEHQASANAMSFKSSFLLIQIFFMTHAENPAIGSLPARIKHLKEEIWRMRLPERRPERHFRRQVKIKMSNYPKAPPPPRMRRLDA